MTGDSSGDEKEPGLPGSFFRMLTLNLAYWGLIADCSNSSPMLCAS